MTVGASAESGEAESLSSGISTIVSALDSAALESALSDDDPFAQTGGFRQTLTAIARGEMTIDFQQTADLLSRQFFSAVRQSLWRLTRLIAPALLWALLKQFSGRSSECGRIVVQLFVCVFLTQDLSDHITLAVATVQQISAGMQGLLPMLLTMMAAVGGSAGSALMQPAVVASASAMTSLISGITVPLAVASGVLCMLCHLGDGIRVQRLAEFTQQCAVWSLGIGFTVFIGVLTTRSVTAAAIDGVTLRTAKYALNNLVPFVGGLFADTVDTLVGSGMLVQSALGVTGLIVIASRAVLPLCQTLAAAMLYKLASALMQPVSDGSLAGCIHDFAKVLMLLFVLFVMMSIAFQHKFTYGDTIKAVSTSEKHPSPQLAAQEYGYTAHTMAFPVMNVRNALTNLAGVVGGLALLAGGAQALLYSATTLANLTGTIQALWAATLISFGFCIPLLPVLPAGFTADSAAEQRNFKPDAGAADFQPDVPPQTARRRAVPQL